MKCYNIFETGKPKGLRSTNPGYDTISMYSVKCISFILELINKKFSHSFNLT